MKDLVGMARRAKNRNPWGHFGRSTRQLRGVVTERNQVAASRLTSIFRLDPRSANIGCELDKLL